jgi:hypothetical protein
MTERKLASVAPRYRQPSSYNPFTGKYAILGREGILSRCAMMQIVGDDETEANEDTHDDYVFCRGYDPESEKFYNKIAVAKPYGVRGTFPYKLAEVYPAIKPMTLLGDTAMVAATTTGQPASLTEELDILYQDAPDDDHPIWWLLLDASGMPMRWGKLDGTLSVGGTQDVSLWQTTGGGWGGWDEDSGEDWTCYAPPLLSSGSIGSGKWVLVGIVNGRKVVLLPEC